MKYIYKSILIATLSGLILALASMGYVSLEWRLIRGLLILLVGIEISILFQNFISANKNRVLLSNIFTSGFSACIVLLLLETGFMFIPKSHGADYSLNSKIWFAKYWNPINSEGYRDNEPNPNKPIIVFIGDSFTQGHGINNVSERFSNQTERILNESGNEVSMVNIGMNGSNTKDEFERTIKMIDKYRLIPKTIVLQYCANDIEDVAMKNGHKLSRFVPFSNIPSWFAPAVKGSYLLNYVYWTLRGPNSYTDFLIAAYNDEKTYQDHLAEL